MRWRELQELNNSTPLPAAFFDVPRRVHFIGIGGIGMSALAFALRARGHAISGSDASESAMLARLRDAGVTTTVGHHAENPAVLGAAAEAVIFSSAIAPDNAERVAAAEQNIVQWHRSQLLAYFVNSAECSIAVSGTHGKSTTSAMIAHILTECGKNPTALLGAEYPPFGSNVRIGDPDLVIVEADESDGSFTLLNPTVAVVTNMEPEHLENYDDNEEELYSAFELFVSQARGTAVLNANDHQVCDRLTVNNTVTFGIGPLNAGLEASNVFKRPGETYFDLFGRYANDHAGPFQLVVPGTHNLSNALAAMLAARVLHVPINEAAEAVKSFHGVARRFEFKGEANSVVVYDDYGHHPTEVRATLEAARDFLQRPVLVIYQPHRYTRTQQMGHEFGPSFEAADRVVITQLYSAFEEPIEGISGRIVHDSVQQEFPDKPLHYAENLHEARRLASELAQPGDAIITMGAGDVSTLGKLILQDLKEINGRGA